MTAAGVEGEERNSEERKLRLLTIDGEREASLEARRVTSWEAGRMMSGAAIGGCDWVQGTRDGFCVGARPAFP